MLFIVHFPGLQSEHSNWAYEKRICATWRKEGENLCFKMYFNVLRRSCWFISESSLVFPCFNSRHFRSIAWMKHCRDWLNEEHVVYQVWTLSKVVTNWSLSIPSSLNFSVEKIQLMYSFRNYFWCIVTQESLLVKKGSQCLLSQNIERAVMNRRGGRGGWVWNVSVERFWREHGVG